MPTSDLSHPAAVLPALLQTLHGMFHDLDARRYDAVVAAFTSDGRWLRQGKWLEGRAAISGALQDRASDLETCHVLSNAFITASDGHAAMLHATMTAYRYPSQRTRDALPEIAGPLRINHVATVFSRQPDDSWQVAEQRLVPLVGFRNV